VDFRAANVRARPGAVVSFSILSVPWFAESVLFGLQWSQIA